MKPNNDAPTPEEKKKRKQVVWDISHKLISGDDDIIKSSLLVYPWLTRHMVHGCARRMRQNMKKYGSYTISSSAGFNLRTTNIQMKSGRPKGTTTQASIEIEDKIREAKDIIATRCYDYKFNHTGTLPTVEFNRICGQVFTEQDLDKDVANIKRKTILSRIARGNLVVNRQQNKETPLLEIEPVLLQFAT